jgi:hypothetical protein
VRGGDVFVCVAVRGGPGGPEVEGALSEAPAGRWRDVLRGDERSFASREAVAGIVGEPGVAVFERL